MKKFTVILTRDVTESVAVEVEAENEEAAKDAALNNTEFGECNFERDEGNIDQPPYVTGCDEIEEEEVEP